MNRLVPVFRLAPEIISEILTYVAHDGENYFYSCRWLKTTHVCHKWREVALHSPRVWSHLCLNSNTDCLKEIIARSKEAPLHVTTGWAVPKGNLDLVWSQLYRIHTLQLQLDISRPEITIPSPFNAPELRCLEVTDKHWKYPHTKPIPSEDWHLPKLQRVKTHCYTFLLPWTGAMFRSPITHLSLYQPIPSTSTLEETLEALAGMPNLQSLELHKVLPPLFHGAGRNAHLPHLKLLDLTDTCKGCSRLLKHLSFPPTATLQICLSGPFPKSDIIQLSAQIAATISHSDSAGPGIRSLLLMGDDYDLVTTWRKQLPVTEVVSDYLKGGDIAFSVNLPNYRPSFDSVLKPVLAPFPLSNVLTLRFRAGETSALSWALLSHSMPNLRELGVSCHRSQAEKSQEVLHLLAVRSPKPDSPVPPPLFPHINVLLLSGLKFCDDAYEDDPIIIRFMRRMLRSRKLAGHTIEELILQDATNLVEADVEDFKKLVGKVTWDPDDVRWEGFTDSEDDSDDEEEDETKEDEPGDHD